MADTFDHAVERMVEKDSHFKKEAYYFLNEALGKAMQEANTKSKLSKPGHVNAASLSLAFQNLALERYGGLSKHVLKHWGIQGSEDIGALVYKLVEDGVWSKTEEDSIEDFKNLIDFDAVFLKPFIAVQDSKPILDRKPEAIREDTLPLKQKKIARAKAAKNPSPNLLKNKKTIKKASATQLKQKPSPPETSAPNVLKKGKAAKIKKEPAKRTSSKRKNSKN